MADLIWDFLLLVFKLLYLDCQFLGYLTFIRLVALLIYLLYHFKRLIGFFFIHI